MMIAHDTREKKARTIRTAFAVIPAEMKSWAMFEPPASVMVSGDSLSGCVPRRTRLGPSRQGSTESSSGSKRWKVLAALVAALALGFAGPARTAPLDRKSVVQGKSVDLRAGLPEEEFGIRDA